MFILYRIVFVLSAYIAVFGLGYYLCSKHQQIQELKKLVNEYQNNIVIENEVKNMDDTAICMALGGMRQQCSAKNLLRLKQTSKSKVSRPASCK